MLHKTTQLTNEADVPDIFADDATSGAAQNELIDLINDVDELVNYLNNCLTTAIMSPAEDIKSALPDFQSFIWVIDDLETVVNTCKKISEAHAYALLNHLLRDEELRKEYFHGSSVKLLAFKDKYANVVEDIIMSDKGIKNWLLHETDFVANADHFSEKLVKKMIVASPTVHPSVTTELTVKLLSLLGKPSLQRISEKSNSNDLSNLPTLMIPPRNDAVKDSAANVKLVKNYCVLTDSPASYGNIIQKSGNTIDGIKALFHDYANPRAFTFHWNRHHKNTARGIANLNPDNMRGFFDYLSNQYKQLESNNANGNGSMMRRMRHALELLRQELAADANVNLTTTMTL
jgi:hypothetical protein